MDSLPEKIYRCFCDVCQQGTEKIMQVRFTGNDHTLHFCSKDCGETLTQRMKTLQNSISGVEIMDVEHSTIENDYINPRELLENIEYRKEDIYIKEKLEALIKSGRIQNDIPGEYFTLLIAIACWFPS